MRLRGLPFRHRLNHGLQQLVAPLGIGRGYLTTVLVESLKASLNGYLNAR